ncbi:MAG: HemK2/MTQ2 family protein methyltransferase [Candidatus Heimdallarchaeaceae archaeon]
MRFLEQDGIQVRDINQYYLDKYNIHLRINDDVYEPAEDSFLMIDNVDIPKNAKIILEIGCGSGIISLALSKKYHNKRFIVSDISFISTQYTNYNVKLNKLQNNIDVICSDSINALINFSPDIILWNPPYLPEEESSFFTPIERMMFFGGKKGYEAVYKLINKFNKRKMKTTFYTIFSSLAWDPEERKRDDSSRIKFEIVKEQKLPFEKLFLVKILVGD